mmetsp:Transcript_8087/g.11237  ORF Transcript_8087/g.11237 Transcript_8087/m.11237 type:complete len:119 (-) Transcript_8087:28-384(-)
MRAFYKQAFIKRHKLIVVIDGDRVSVATYKSLLREAGYRGTFTSRRSLETAVKFLNTVKSREQRDQVVAADLIFVTFGLRKHKLKSILDQLTGERGEVSDDLENPAGGDTDATKTIVS